MLINIIEHIKFGSCLLWVMSTEISVDIAVDIAVDSRSIVGRQSVDGWSIVGRQSVDSRSIVGRQSVDSEIDYRPSIGRYFDDAPRLTIGHMSVIYRSTVGGISVNCRWYISQLSVVYRSTVGGISVNCRSNQSCVNLSGESNGFFF